MKAVKLALTTDASGNAPSPFLAKVNFNTDQMVYPRVACALNTDGTALTVYDMPLAAGDLKAVIAQGGNAKSGSVIVFLLD